MGVGSGVGGMGGRVEDVLQSDEEARGTLS